VKLTKIEHKGESLTKKDQPKKQKGGYNGLVWLAGG
jgi:hypothetical protein